jgi:predicted O-methyltransferase YrrM
MLVLYGLIRANGLRTLVEIGVMKGVTTAFLAKAARQNGGHVYAVDNDLGRVCDAEQHLYRLGYWPSTVSFIVSDSGRCLFDCNVDFLFIDGDHSYEGVSGDWVNWSPKLTLGAIAAFHDTRDERIERFLRETFPNPKFEYINFLGDCGLALVRRIA